MWSGPKKQAFPSLGADVLSSAFASPHAIIAARASADARVAPPLMGLGTSLALPTLIRSFT